MGTVNVPGRGESTLKTKTTIVNTTYDANRNIETQTVEIGLSTSKLAGGERFGKVEFVINQKTGEARVKYINSSQALKGQGVGARMYAAAMQKSKELGAKVFNSDSRVSESAYRTWQSLKSKGVSVTTNRSTYNAGLKQYEGTGGKGIFQVDLRKISSQRLRDLMGGS